VPIVGAIGTTPREAARPVATAGRLPAASGKPASAYLDFHGRRWVSDGKALELDATFMRIGDYRGSPVYTRNGDSQTIYIPTATGLVAPFRGR